MMRMPDTERSRSRRPRPTQPPKNRAVASYATTSKAVEQAGGCAARLRDAFI
jgi:hypothetical protein